MNIYFPDSRRLRLLEWLLHSDKYLVEYQNATCSAIVGLLFLLDNTHLYTRYPDTYKNLEFTPPYVWGILFLSIGLLHLFCIYFEWVSYRKHILLLKSGLWVFIAVMVLPADPWAVSGYFYLVFSIMAFRGFLQIRYSKKET